MSTEPIAPRHSDHQRQTIVVGVDASPLSVSGLRLAAVVARRWGARVEAVHVEDTAVSRLSHHPGVVAVCGLTARSLRWRRRASPPLLRPRLARRSKPWRGLGACLRGRRSGRRRPNWYSTADGAA